MVAANSAIKGASLVADTLSPPLSVGSSQLEAAQSRCLREGPGLTRTRLGEDCLAVQFTH